MSVMSQQFQMSRWSPERRKIHNLEVGKSARFVADKYSNVKASVEHLNHAYGGERQWEMKTHFRATKVTRIV